MTNGSFEEISLIEQTNDIEFQSGCFVEFWNFIRNLLF